MSKPGGTSGVLQRDFGGHCQRGSGTRHHASTGTVAWPLHGSKGFETQQSALPADTFELSRNPVVTQRHGPEVTLSVTQITAVQGPAGTQARTRCICSPARARLTPKGVPAPLAVNAVAAMRRAAGSPSPRRRHLSGVTLVLRNQALAQGWLFTISAPKPLGPW